MVGGDPMKRFMVGLLGFVLVWLANAPATWLSLILQYASGGHLHLANESGTIWNGAAEVNWQEEATVIPWPGRVEWQLHPVWGGVTVALHQAGAVSRLEGVARWRWGEWQWQPGEAQCPVALLRGLGSPFSTLRPTGSLSLRWGAGRWEGSRMSLWTVDVIWRQAGTRLAPLSPLGDYRVRLTGQKDGMHLVLTTIQGPLQLSGEGGEVQGNFRFSGRAWADPVAKTVLAGFLSILGKPDGEGVHLEWNR